MRVGVEVGGTFTDLIQIRDGVINVEKVPSTPHSPDIGVLNAIDAAGIDLQHVTSLVHGTTVATNAVLERKGAHLCVFVTKGTRDIFALQRHDRRAIYDLHYRKPRPIVSNEFICELDERIAADGSVIQPINVKLITDQIKNFTKSKTFDGVAICLLNSYANSLHERQIAEIVRTLFPEITITCSCDVSPEFREYERASSTALSAYVQPCIEGYLNRLSDTIETRGFTGDFSIMQSNGGRMPAQAMGQNAITALYSGPAAGVIGAVTAAKQAGFKNIITLDMGGTSTDVSSIVDHIPDMSSQTVVDGLPVRTPVIDIATVGSGGGSIAWVDDGDMLHVGPHSAGATPGPASYMRGGTHPTVTDAHLIRGTLQAQSFLGGKMTVDVEAARQAFVPLSKQLNMSIEDLADATIRLAEAGIIRAIQQVSTERGYDPRSFTLVPYGGAGALHAARVAEELGIKTILVPNNAGVLSAVGLLEADYIFYKSKTRRFLFDENSVQSLKSELKALQSLTEKSMTDLGLDGTAAYEITLEMRYVGQAFEIPVPLICSIDALDFPHVLEAFSDAHHRIFEFSKPTDKKVEIVSFKVGARCKLDAHPLDMKQVSPICQDKPLKSIDIVERKRSYSCRLLSRDDIDAQPMEGPMLLEDGTATIFIPPGWRAQKDCHNHLILNYE